MTKRERERRMREIDETLREAEALQKRAAEIVRQMIADGRRDDAQAVVDRLFAEAEASGDEDEILDAFELKLLLVQ